MITKIDWISFSVLIEAGESRGLAEVAQLISDALYSLSSSLGAWIGLEGEIIPSIGRKPYSHAWTLLETGAVVFAHPALSHALVELSGQVCERLRESGHLLPLLSAVRSRLTRLDIATDILTDTTPTDFAVQRDVKRFKSFSEFQSSSGSTYYVGSRTSDRYARVYRYNPPHERAHLLRVETVLKAEQAKAAVPTILQDGVEHMSTLLGNTFGWTHPSWQPDVQTDERAAAWRPERHEGKTLFWLNATVAPSIIKMHQEGTLDAQDWFDTYIRPKLDGER